MPTPALNLTTLIIALIGKRSFTKRMRQQNTSQGYGISDIHEQQLKNFTNEQHVQDADHDDLVDSNDESDCKYYLIKLSD
jgi:hypothetical protein